MRLKRTDHLGLRSASADRMLPLLVAAMSFLAALTLAAALAAALLARQWKGDTAAALTVQVPHPDDPAAKPGASRLQSVLTILQADPQVSGIAQLTHDQIAGLLRPWLGADLASLAVPLPAVVTATWNTAGAPDALQTALQAAAPGSFAATGAVWAARVASLTTSLQEAAAGVLVIVGGVAAAVVAGAIRVGLAQRREAIEIIHGLGALDGDIAAQFAGRALVLAAFGAAAGAAAAVPVLYWLIRIAAPFAGAMGTSLAFIPVGVWVMLPGLPVAAAMIGWITAQLTVRGWLRRLA